VFQPKRPGVAIAHDEIVSFQPLFDRSVTARSAM
jgi:hypothetical protein